MASKSLSHTDERDSSTSGEGRSCTTDVTGTEFPAFPCNPNLHYTNATPSGQVQFRVPFSPNDQQTCEGAISPHDYDHSSVDELRIELANLRAENQMLRSLSSSRVNDERSSEMSVRQSDRTLHSQNMNENRTIGLHMVDRSHQSCDHGAF